MRVIMLSWEYPPKIVGGIARHVYDLAHALVAQGVEVHVVTCEHPGAAAEEVEDGIHLYRVTPRGHANDFIHWVQLLNDAMYARADVLIPTLLETSPAPNSGGAESDWLAPAPPELGAGGRSITSEPLVLHAHDWLAHYAANGLKHKYHLPMLATIHATEHGRNNGINGPVQEYINSVEWELQNEAWRVIVCTEFMKRECEHALHTPWDKMDVIPNGVDPAKFRLPDFTPEEKAAFRSRYAAPEEKIIFFVGRMVREKGVQVLIEALPKVRWGYHDAKVLVCGGGHRDHLVNLAAYLGMERHVYFAGFVPDADLMKIYQIIDIACFPSLYEPFGIVALEGMAAHVPVVVSDAGGLPEVVENGITGITTYAGNPNSLADGLLKILHEPDTARRLADEAYKRVETVFNWDRIATQTLAVYERVWTEYEATDWV
jgi:glycosyltransferase involved in cell wall biosynthesis